MKRIVFVYLVLVFGLAFSGLASAQGKKSNIVIFWGDNVTVQVSEGLALTVQKS